MLGSGPALVQRPGADGRFVYTNVPPGHYTLTARGSSTPPLPSSPVTTMSARLPDAGPSDAYSYAQADLDISGEAVANISLTLLPGSTLSGRVVFDGAPSSRRPEMTALRVGFAAPGPAVYTIRDGALTASPLTVPLPVTVRPDGTFTVRGIGPGVYVLHVTVPAAAEDTWDLASAVAGTRDLLDAPIDVTAGDRFADAVITFSDRKTEISGTLTTADGRPAPEYVIIAIPAERERWQKDSRRLQLARPDTRGRFSVQGLPPGEYLLAALTDLDPDELNDRQFLEQVAVLGVRVTLAAGGHAVQDLGLTATR
jgi:hypothetical protein